jgi:putative oxygen-independent coproporphyrinogen III oxidase
MAGIYLHIPFCGRKCGYCDFYSIPERSGDIRSFCVSLLKEIESAAAGRPLEGRAADTVFFGGGTPSLLAVSEVRDLLGAVLSGFGLAAGAEVTMEANPGTLTEAGLAGYREAGVNRMSLGVQSFSDAELGLLSRSHTAAESEAAVKMSRDAGFANVGLDLLFGVPGQDAESLRRTLETAVSLGPDHISAYGLTVHEETPFGDRVRSGEAIMPSDEESADLFLLTSSVLSAAGFEHYEVSNYAKPGMRCRHNEGYWTQKPYLGLGPSAHSYYGGLRRWNVSELAEYSERIRTGRSPEAGSEIIDAEKARIEAIGLGLRRSEGISLEAYSPDLAWVGEWVASGLAKVEAGRLRLTARGFLLADAIAAELV